MAGKKFLRFFAVWMLLFLAVMGEAGCGGGGGGGSPGGDNQQFVPNPETSQDQTPQDQNQQIPQEQETSADQNQDILEPEPSGNFAVVFDSAGGSDVPEQEVQPRQTATEPTNPRREGFTFMGWYMSEGFSFTFNFNTPISRDTVLFAKWWDNNDTTDSDGDGLIDSLEHSFGTDPLKPDTDGDGLTDWEELNWLDYNPLAKDTDGNGTPDGDEDADGDGLTNILEGNYNSNMILADTDHDGLNDYDEVYSVGTLPDNPDTDGDGVDDGTEVRIGSDPLRAETVFATVVSTDIIASGKGSVDIAVRMNSSADAAGTLTIRRAERSDNVLVSQWIPGFLDAAYQIESGASFDSAEIEFSVSESFGGESDTFKPRIYMLDSETGAVTELEDQTYENGKITARVSHFSIYILLNKVEFDAVWDTSIRPPSVSADVSSDAKLDIVFVIDTSSSMGGNDPNKLAVELPKQLTDKLRDGKDRGAIVTFADNSHILSGLTDDKEALYTIFDSIYYYGMTNGKDGLFDGVNMLVQSSDADYKYVVFLTDGSDTEYSEHPYEDTISMASADNIMIYTIGMGYATEDTLKQIATGTGGAYFYAETAEKGLERIYETIQQETIDYTTDTNSDGISDYYTRLLAEGRMKIQNGTDSLMLIDVVSNDPLLSKDWDGDGLLNSEEIEIIGGPYAYMAMMKSNPVRADTDGDGFSDFKEVKEMKTSPLKYTRFGAVLLKALRNDDIFPSKYVDFSKESHSAYVNGFACKIDEWARNAIIDYFTENSTDITVDANLETSDVYYGMFELLEANYDALTNFLSLFQSITDFAGEIDALDESVRNSAEVIEKRQNIENLQHKAAVSRGNVRKAARRQMEREQKMLNDILTGQDDKTLWLDLGGDLADEIEFMDEIRDEFEATESTVKIAIASQNMETASKLVGIGALVMKAGTTAAKIPQVTNKIPLKLKNMGKVVGSSNSAASILGKVGDFAETAGEVLTVAIDVTTTVKDVVGVLKTFSKIKRNYSEFLKYSELLGEISRNYTYPRYVRDAALGMYETFKKSDSPNWKKLNEEVAKTLGTTIALDAFELVFDALVIVPSPIQPVMQIIAVVRAITKALCKFGGFEDRAEVIVNAHVHYAIANTSSRILGTFVNYAGDDSEYFEYTSDKETDFYKYAVQLAQGRIAGLSGIMDYIIDGSLAGFWDRGSHFWDLFGNDAAKREQQQRLFEQAIEVIRRAAVVLKLNLSPSLM